MSLYAVKNDKGEWLYSDKYIEWVDQPSLASFYDTFEDANDDIECWELSNAHVVELVEGPEKIVVSAEEAEMLTEAKTATYPAEYITRHSWLKQGSEDRLMRAYVIGWEVEKPKLWNVKVPHSDDGYYWRGISGQVHTCTEPDQHARVLKTDAYVWTQKQIDDACLQGCEKVEVTEDDD